MTDLYDRAQAREAEMLADALRDHHRRAGLVGKTAADSSAFCQAKGCDEPIPETRRQAVPGCKFCVACQTRQERKARQ